VLVEGDYGVEWEPDDDYIAPIVTLYSGHLWCGACNLELDGEDEMNAADLAPWQLDDVDETDFYDDW
jgi:hypothetical protein